MAQKVTSTILRVYLYDKSRPGKEEGVINICNDEGKVTDTQVHFDDLDDLPSKIRELLRKANVTWPRPSPAMTAPVQRAEVVIPPRTPEIPAAGVLPPTNAPSGPPLSSID
jgi:hypothetical protein